MSRLYNTLEKIRIATHEGRPASPSRAATSPTAPRIGKPLLWLALGCLVVASTATVGFLLAARNGTKLFHLQTVSPPQQPGQGNSTPKITPAPSSTTPATPQNREVSALRLNESGIALLRDGQHWRSIHAFEQARQLTPGQPEALINMAVALAELGLRIPAHRLFKEAMTISPDHPQLRQNLGLLGNAGFFDDPPPLTVTSDPQTSPSGSSGTPPGE